MEKEFVNDKEAICLLISFIIGSSLILGTSGQAENDSWIAAIFGIAMAVPMVLAYARIMSLYQGQDLFDILIALLGKAAGRIVGALYIIYALHLGALVLRNFGEFMKIEALPETPLFISMFCLGIVSIIAVRLGIEVMARTCTFFLPIVFFILFVVELLTISQFHISYLKPVFGNGLIPILQGSFSAFSFPFAETVLFIGIFSSLRTKQSPYKVFRWGFLIAGFTLVAVIVRNIGVLGNMRGSFYFPSYEAVSKIKIGDFLQRIEVTVSFVFFFGVFIKSSVCLLAASKGISKIFNLKDYRSIVIQTGLLMIYFAYIVYDNSMQMNYWAIKVYPYYAFPFQVVIPLIVWIFAEIKARKGQGNNTNQ
jgi:spore germination protein KB